MRDLENNGNRGWTLAELIPALAIFGMASAALLAGFHQLSGFAADRTGLGRGIEVLAGAARETARIMTETGSDPWEAPPACRISGDTLTLTYRHNNRTCQTAITCESRQDAGTDPVTIITLTAESGTYKALYPAALTAAPWSDTSGILRGLLLSAGSDRSQSLFIPFGRQTP